MNTRAFYAQERMEKTQLLHAINRARERESEKVRENIADTKNHKDCVERSI